MLDLYLISEYTNSVCMNIKNKKVRENVRNSLNREITELAKKYAPYFDNDDIAVKKAIQHFGNPLLYAEKINNENKINILDIFNLCFF